MAVAVETMGCRGQERRRPAAARLAPALFVILWSSAFIAGVIGVGAAPPLLLVSTRFACAGVLMAAFAAAAHASWPRGRDLLHVVVAGLLIQAVQFGALYMALGQGLPGGIVALVQGINPLVIAALAARVLDESISVRQWVGFGIGGIGVLVAISGVLRASWVAIVLCVIGLAAFSIGTVYQKRFVTKVDLRTATAVQFLISAPVVGLACIAVETPRVVAWAPFLAALGWMTLVNSVGVFALLYAMLRRSPASRVGSLFFLTPSVTALMCWVVVGQRPYAAEVIGLAIAGAGVLLAQRAR